MSSVTAPKDFYFIPDQNFEFGMHLPKKYTPRHLNVLGKIVRWHSNDEHSKWQRIGTYALSVLALLTIACTGIGVYFIIKALKEKTQDAKEKQEYESFMKKIGIDPKEEEGLQRGTVDRMRDDRDKVVNLVESNYEVLGYRLGDKIAEAGSSDFFASTDLPYSVVKGNNQNGHPFYAFVLRNKTSDELNVMYLYQDQTSNWGWCEAADFGFSKFHRIKFVHLESIIMGTHYKYEVYCDNTDIEFYNNFTQTAIEN